MKTKHRFETLSSRLLRAFENTDQPEDIELTLKNDDPHYVDIGVAPLPVRWLYCMINEIDWLISQLSKQIAKCDPGDENQGRLEMEEDLLSNQNQALHVVMHALIVGEVDSVASEFEVIAFSKDWHVLISNQQLRERVHEPLVEQIPAGDQKKYH